MAKMKMFFETLYGFDKLADFAEDCGIDWDIFCDFFWHTVVIDRNNDVSPEETYWKIWNWIDCEGEEDIDG